MTTQRSSFDMSRVRPLIRNTLHRCRGLTAFYTVLLFLSLPIPFGVTVYNAHQRFIMRDWMDATWFTFVENNTAAASHLYNVFSAVFFTMLAAVMPLILSISLYSYMHNRRSVDVYHSLPLTRQELFLGNAIAAAIILWVPLAAAFLAAGLIAALVPGMSVVLVLKDLFFWAAAMLAIFAIGAFCATQVGTPQDQALFTLVVSVSASGVAILLNLLAQEHIYGYTVGDSFYNLVYRLCPFSLMIGRHLAATPPYYSDSNTAAIVWLVLAVVLLLVSAWLYARRKSEQAEVLGNLGPLQLYVRLIGTIGGAVCVGFLICSFLDISFSSKLVLLCIALGGLIVYPIGDAVLARRVRPIKQILPVGLASVAIAVLICAATVFDLFGYENRVPAFDQIASVSVDGVRTRYLSQDQADELFFEEPESVALVLDAHRAQIADRESDDNGYRPMQLRLTYRLKNGRTMQRSYHALSAGAQDILETLETNDEALRNTAAVFGLKPGQVRRVTVTDAIDGEAADLRLDAAQTEALLEALRADLLAQPQSELEAGGTPLATVTIEAEYPRKANTPYAVAETRPAQPEEDVYFRTYAYLVTESFDATLRALGKAPEVRAKGVGDGSLGEIGSVSFELYPDWLSWSGNLWFTVGSVDILDEIVYYYRDVADKYSEGVEAGAVPFRTVSAEEFAAEALAPAAYCPNRAEARQRLVAIFYYRKDADPRFDKPSGLAFTTLESLSPALQRQLIDTYDLYHGEDGYYQARLETRE